MSNTDSNDWLDKKKLNCGYCRRRPPLKWCKRHTPKVTIRKTKMYSQEDVDEMVRGATTISPEASIAMMMAKQQISRGENPPINTTTALLMELERIAQLSINKKRG